MYILLGAVFRLFTILVFKNYDVYYSYFKTNKSAFI